LEGSDWRVQSVNHANGFVSYVIYGPAGLDERSDDYLRTLEASTSRTYAYRLVEYLAWRDAQGLTDGTVTLRHLEQHMASIASSRGAGPLGVAVPWRSQPLSESAQGNAATAIRGYYLHCCAMDPTLNPAVADALRDTRLTSKAARNASRRDRPKTTTDANPLAPKRSNVNVRLMPQEAHDALFADGILTTARDRMIVTWLWDMAPRVGGLCGLRFEDLHLVENHPCREMVAPHVHIVRRLDNPNRALAKGAPEPNVAADGIVRGGVLLRVSPQMLSTYWDYLLEDYHRVRSIVNHQMVLVVLEPNHLGNALTTQAVRRMVKRAGKKANLGILKPHAFRHRWATEFLRASKSSAMTAQAGGWKNTETVESVYAHLVGTPELEQALTKVWQESSPV
jgi:integrase